MKIYSAFPIKISAAIPALAGKVFPANAVEGYSAPYSTYELVGAEKLQTLDGYEDETDFIYQHNFWHTSYDTAKEWAEMYWDYIKNYSGSFGDCYLDVVEYMSETEISDLVGGKSWFCAILEIKYKCVKE